MFKTIAKIYSIIPNDIQRLEIIQTLLAKIYFQFGFEKMRQSDFGQV